MRPSRAIFATVRRDNPKNFAISAVVANGSILLNLGATVASTKYSRAHWEQGLCSGVGSLRFNCDLKEFKHHASHCFNWAPPSSSWIVTAGDPCWFASVPRDSTHTRFPPRGQSAVIRPYRKNLLGDGEEKIRFDVFLEETQTYLESCYAFASTNLAAELHRQHGYRVRFNDNSQYPQVLQIVEEVPLPKSTGLPPLMLRPPSGFE